MLADIPATPCRKIKPYSLINKFKNMEKCKKCGLNPNEQQDQEQQKWESDFIKENGECSACQNEN